jgi:hypothetical protein
MLRCLALVAVCGIVSVGTSRGDDPIEVLKVSGAELKGWTRVPIPPGSALKDPSPWRFDPATGVLTCEGKGHHEWLRLDRELGDAKIHVEWRFVPIDEGKGYNSGVMIRNSIDGVVWHQAQTGDASGGYLFGETPGAEPGKRQSFRAAGDAPHGNVKPAGEWNVYDITCQGKTLTLRTNGGDAVTFDGCNQPRGYFGLEAEFFTVEFRNVTVEALR